ncbi:MAG: amidohydrolase [Methylobacteriaceae bacterium]|jgi:hippurate hydrolase|nr:amidohydrolase [Methylobacteriaceae bacterium]
MTHTASAIADIIPEVTAWRRDFHAHPELGFEETRTAALVAERLRVFGFDEVATGIGKTGVVGVLKGKRPGNRAIAIRADMDALPIEEATDLPYTSLTPGVMHACGHDGHTAILLGAAKILAATRDFAGTAVLVFQPAEELGSGAGAMLRDGLFERFPVEEIYGLHNQPGLARGRFAIRPGAMMASADPFIITVRGKSGHAASPQETIDPIVTAAAIITGLQTVVSRTVNPRDAVVLTVGSIKAGEAGNVIPDTAVLLGTLRTLNNEARVNAQARAAELVRHIAAGFGAEADYKPRSGGCPVTFNDPEKTAVLAGIAEAVAGKKAVERDYRPSMGSEDFSFLLERKPGAFIYIGSGDIPTLHNAGFNFPDDILPHGIALWVKTVETVLKG